MMQITPGIQLLRKIQRLRLQDYRLIAFDMDSTLITIETLDELAEIAGCREHIQAVTEAAMRGVLPDFTKSLRLRAALLAGLPKQVIHQVCEQRLRLNPGAMRLVEACKTQGLRFVLITSGFTCFADRVQEMLALDESRANVLEIEDDRVTGRVFPQPERDFVDGDEKKHSLLKVCAQMGISHTQAIAVGDGANDVPMLLAAGLSVTYRAKPVVRARAHLAIDQGGMDRLLEILEVSS